MANGDIVSYRLIVNIGHIGNVYVVDGAVVVEIVPLPIPAGIARIFALVWESSGESRFMLTRPFQLAQLGEHTEFS